MKTKRTKEFLEWLKTMPEGVRTREKHSTQLTITMTVTNWMVLREAAIHESKTMDALASQILSESDELMEKSAGP